MFEVEYRIVRSDYDEFVGQNGFFQLKCNKCLFGEMYPKEIEKYMDKESLVDWFARMFKVAKYLNTKEYVALSVVESFDLWIVFQKRNEDVVISVVKATKRIGSQDIEFELENATEGDWKNQVVSYKQFCDEIYTKTKEYVYFIRKNNNARYITEKMSQSFKELFDE